IAATGKSPSGVTLPAGLTSRPLGSNAPCWYRPVGDVGVADGSGAPTACGASDTAAPTATSATAAVAVTHGTRTLRIRDPQLEVKRRLHPLGSRLRTVAPTRSLNVRRPLMEASRAGRPATLVPNRTSRTVHRTGARHSYARACGTGSTGGRRPP